VIVSVVLHGYTVVSVTRCSPSSNVTDVTGTVETEMHIDRRMCARRVQRTQQMHVTKALALPTGVVNICVRDDAIRRIEREVERMHDDRARVRRHFHADFHVSVKRQSREVGQQRHLVSVALRARVCACVWVFVCVIVWIFTYPSNVRAAKSGNNVTLYLV
jgi:hypothetical protein